MPDQLTPGAVTTADLYRELVEIRRDQADALIEIRVITVRNAEADQLHRDYESRLRALERFRFTIMGIAVSVSTLTGISAGIIAALTTGHH